MKSLEQIEAMHSTETSTARKNFYADCIKVLSEFGPGQEKALPAALAMARVGLSAGSDYRRAACAKIVKILEFIISE